MEEDKGTEAFLSGKVCAEAAGMTGCYNDAADAGRW